MSRERYIDHCKAMTSKINAKMNNLKRSEDILGAKPYRGTQEIC